MSEKFELSKIGRYCQLVVEINERNESLKKEFDEYWKYDGGQPPFFEDNIEIKEISMLEQELQHLLKNFTKPLVFRK